MESSTATHKRYAQNLGSFLGGDSISRRHRRAHLGHAAKKNYTALLSTWLRNQFSRVHEMLLAAQPHWSRN